MRGRDALDLMQESGLVLLRLVLGSSRSCGSGLGGGCGRLGGGGHIGAGDFFDARHSEEW